MTKTAHYHPKSVLPKQQSYIDGAYLANQSGDTFTTAFPGTNDVICEIETAGLAETDAAVSAACDAYPAWSSMPAAERGNILRDAARILRERNQELAELETLDTGKPISETKQVDIISGAEVIEYFCWCGAGDSWPAYRFATSRVCNDSS